MKTQMKKPEDLQRLILHISTDFTNLVPGEVDYKINEALKQIGEFTGSDRSYVFLLNRSLNTMTNTHEWCAAGIEPQIANLKSLNLSERQWLQEKLLKKEIVEIDDIHSLPDWATLEKGEFQAQDIRSLIIAPMVYNKDTIGFIGFNSVRNYRRWSADEISLLKIVADIFTNTIIHRSLVNKLHNSEEQYRLLVENLNDGIVISQNDKFIFINKQFAGMLGYNYDELIMADYQKVYAKKGLEILWARQRRRQNGERVPSRYETIFKKKNGAEIYVEANVHIINYKGALATFAIISDISERKKIEMYQRKLELELLKRQKVSNLGLFAGGIVHNIRNILTVITGRAQMLKQKMPDLKEPDIIISNANKIVKIADNLLKKAKKEREHKIVEINLNDLIKSEIMFLESNLYERSQIDIEFDLQRDLPPVKGLYSDFSHGISTVIEFSINSMAESAVKRLGIKTSAEGNYIELAISHTGKELLNGELQQMFTPLYSLEKFTAKNRIDRESLHAASLYNAYLLLDHYKVKIRVENKPDKSTGFYLKIPVNG